MQSSILANKSEHNKNSNNTVYVVDDDRYICEAICELLEKLSICCRIFNSAEEFIDSLPLEESGCIILDISMRGMSGIELQKNLIELKCDLPIIFLTGNCTVGAAVDALKDGAFDFLEKPINNERFIGVIKEALAKSEKAAVIRNKIKSLTARENEIYNFIITGRCNKAIAEDLGVSISTVEFHRSNIMKKLNAKNLAELIAIGQIN